MIKLQKIFATGVDNKKLHIHKSFGQQIEAGREAAGLLSEPQRPLTVCALILVPSLHIAHSLTLELPNPLLPGQVPLGRFSEVFQ